MVRKGEVVFVVLLGSGTGFLEQINLDIRALVIDQIDGSFIAPLDACCALRKIMLKILPKTSTNNRVLNLAKLRVTTKESVMEVCPANGGRGLRNNSKWQECRYLLLISKKAASAFRELAIGNDAVIRSYSAIQSNVFSYLEFGHNHPARELFFAGRMRLVPEGDAK